WYVSNTRSAQLTCGSFLRRRQLLLLLLDLLQQAGVHRVPRNATRRVLAELVTFGPHQRRAVAAREAPLLLVRVHVAGEVRIRNRPPAHADDRHAIVAKIGLPGLDRIVSQVAIAGSDDRKIRTGTMCRLGEFEMTRDTNE